MATYGKQSGKHTARIRLGTYKNFQGGFDTKKGGQADRRPNPSPRNRRRAQAGEARSRGR